MNFDIATLDTPTITEIVDEIGCDVLESMLEDGDLRDEEFENTMEMFNDTLLQNSLDLDVDIANDPLIDFEASLEPIILEGEDMMKAFDHIGDVGSSVDTETESSDPKYDVRIQHSSVDDIELYTSSVVKSTEERDDYVQRKAQSQTTIDDQAKASDVDKRGSLTKELKNKQKSSSPDRNRYRDCSQITDEEAVAGISYENLRGRTKEVFPVKLHKIMEYSERYGFSSIISWMPHGRSFKIHDEDIFVEKVMSHFFFQSKMSSFTRQLRMYGFHKIKGKNNVDKGAYFHELFLRGRPGLCHGIVRLDKPFTLHKEDEPNFYLYPPMISSNETGDIKPDSETPKCIRYSDSTSTKKPAQRSKRPMNASSGVMNVTSNTVVQNNCPHLVNGVATLPQLYQNRGAPPQVMSGDAGKNVQVIYVFQNGPAPMKNTFPLNYFRSQRRLL